MKTLLIDDHVLFRQGMKFLLTDLDSRVEFIEADSCKVALDQYAGEDIEVILLDYHIPGEVGREALAKINQVFSSSAKAIIMSNII